MIRFITLLLVLQLIGEALSAGLSLVLPGPVIGMLLLLIGLLLRDRWRHWRRARPSSAPGAEGREADAEPAAVPVPSAVDQVTGGLLNNLSLLFVPAGVGVILHIDLLREAWLPLLVALVVSTLAAVAVTALVVDRLQRSAGGGRHG